MAEDAGRARAALTAALARVGAALRDVVVGASGSDAYANYLAHQRRHHPDTPPLSREAFAVADQAARWEGVRRCC
jgi:uncharacterized short protein YbdD (DUF466 family)